MQDFVYLLKGQDFIREVAVACPKCKAKALVSGGEPDKMLAEYEHKVHFSCPTCHYVLKYTNTPKFRVYTNKRGQNISSRLLMLNSPCDPFFGFEVWYQMDTQNGLLWAYNLEHLVLIENYIAKRQSNCVGLPFDNNSRSYRLIQGVLDVKNRETILKTIQRVKKT